MNLKNKYINVDGRITIPREFRLALGIDTETELEIELLSNGVMIKKALTVCEFCDNTEHLYHVGNIAICRTCADIIDKNLKKKRG